jgi:hypothetical protein
MSRSDNAISVPPAATGMPQVSIASPNATSTVLRSAADVRAATASASSPPAALGRGHRHQLVPQALAAGISPSVPSGCA